MNYRVVELLLEDGSSPYADWFATLDPVAAAKITVAKVRIAQGNLSNVDWFRGIGEYKIDWGPGYRVYFGRDGLAVIVLLCGGDKRKQDADIRKAVQAWQNYVSRKGHGPGKSN